MRRTRMMESPYSDSCPATNSAKSSPGSRAVQGWPASAGDHVASAAAQVSRMGIAAVHRCGGFFRCTVLRRVISAVLCRDASCRRSRLRETLPWGRTQDCAGPGGSFLPIRDRSLHRCYYICSLCHHVPLPMGPIGRSGRGGVAAVWGEASSGGAPSHPGRICLEPTAVSFRAIRLFGPAAGTSDPRGIPRARPRVSLGAVKRPARTSLHRSRRSRVGWRKPWNGHARGSNGR